MSNSELLTTSYLYCYHLGQNTTLSCHHRNTHLSGRHAFILLPTVHSVHSYYSKQSDSTKCTCDDVISLSNLSNDCISFRIKYLHMNSGLLPLLSHFPLFFLFLVHSTPAVLNYLLFSIGTTALVFVLFRFV